MSTALLSNQRRLSHQGLALIKTSEALRLQAYLCPSNRLTIGYGHALVPADFVYFKGCTMRQLDQHIRQCQADKRLTLEARNALFINTTQADLLLLKDTQLDGEFINSMLPNGLSQNEFDALSSLVFNIGQGNFTTSTLLKCLKAGDRLGASLQFSRWIYGTVNGKKIKLNGLITRREQERALFLGL